VKTSQRVETLAALPNYNLFLCDVTPRQLLNLAGSRLSEGYKRQLASYRYGPGVFKVDYALNAPIPWKASECLRARLPITNRRWDVPAFRHNGYGTERIGPRQHRKRPSPI
jgi:phytoene dehydrogenase-like protein